MTVVQEGSEDMQVELMLASAASQESCFGAESELKLVFRYGSANHHSFSFACKQHLEMGVWLWCCSQDQVVIRMVSAPPQA